MVIFILHAVREKSFQHDTWCGINMTPCLEKGGEEYFFKHGTLFLGDGGRGCSIMTPCEKTFPATPYGENNSTATPVRKFPSTWHLLWENLISMGNNKSNVTPYGRTFPVWHLMGEHFQCGTLWENISSMTPVRKLFPMSHVGKKYFQFDNLQEKTFPAWHLLGEYF